MKSILGSIILVIGTGSALLAESPEPSIDAVEKQFRELPMSSRRLTGPLFWLHGDESRERLRMYVGKVAEGGNGCFTAESRPHSDWLGPGWWRDLAICLAAAREHDLKLWIFDEKWWPSGEVGGKVPERYGSKRIVAKGTSISGPTRFTAAGFGGNLIAVLAGKESADDVTMVEIFGARGQDVTYPEMKWWTDHMHVSGVNFHIPHSFNPRAPRDTDCPPYFYNGGFEPLRTRFTVDRRNSRRRKP